MTLTVLRSTCQVFCRMSSIWILLFSHDGIRVMSFGKKSREVKCLSYCILSGSTWYQHDITGDVNLDHLGRMVSARFLQWKLFPSSIFKNQLINKYLSGICKGPPSALKETSGTLEHRRQSTFCYKICSSVGVYNSCLGLGGGGKTKEQVRLKTGRGCTW